jgi:hypothetical protein
MNRQSGVPRNLGWRFSDDIDPAGAALYCDSMSVDDLAELEEDVEAAVAESFPLAKNDLAQCSSPSQVEEAKKPATPTTIGTFLNLARPRLGPSPLQVSSGHNHESSDNQLTHAQNVTTCSIIKREELMANLWSEGIDSLGLDEKVIATTNSVSTGEEKSHTQPIMKKSLKRWWRGVVGLMTDEMPYQQVQIGGGWW